MVHLDLLRQLNLSIAFGEELKYGGHVVPHWWQHMVLSQYLLRNTEYPL